MQILQDGWNTSKGDKAISFRTFSNSHNFLRFALEADALRFGSFQTKAGRRSPYFFNAGLFSHGESLAALGRFYAETILRSEIPFDLLFGPAYKGIPLAVATAIALSENHQRNIPIAFNRKEIKDHGEGGQVIGAPLRGRVLIIDDVISAGTSVRESHEIIQSRGATLAGVVVALDRQERGSGVQSAVQEVRSRYNIPVMAIATLEDLIQLLRQTPPAHALHEHLEPILSYRELWGDN